MSLLADPSSSTSSGLGYASKAVATAQRVEPISKKKRGPDDIEIRLEFGGGLHLLFSSTPKHTIYLPATVDSHPATMKDLVRWMKDHLVSEREEMFGEGDGVRPGILVLINDADWELEGELEYELNDRDEVVFISTLHGG